MNRVAVVLFALLFCLSGVCSSEYPKAFKESHLIQISGTDDDESCTATAVGPHVLLTAAHCQLPEEEISVDGEEADIVEILTDNADHALMFLKGIKFPVWAEFSDETPEFGDEVFIVGNPGEYNYLLRKGYVSGTDSIKVGGRKDLEYIVDLNGYFGDSGAALFNKSGKIISTISTIEAGSHAGASYKFMGYLPMAFTKEARERAVKF